MTSGISGQPRVLLGAIILLLTAVVGAWAWTATTSSEDYWILARDVVEGAPVTSGDLAVASATVASGVRLVGADRAIPDGAVWSTSQSRATFLTDGAWTTTPEELIEVPIRVEPGDAPVDLAAGDRVDVWVVSDGDLGSRLVLSGVPVRDVGSTPAAAHSTVLVGLDQALEPSVMHRLATGRATVVRHA